MCMVGRVQIYILDTNVFIFAFQIMNGRVIIVYRQISNFTAISWREHVTFDEMMIISILY